MPETHYIEIDEEIISAVGRLRKSGVVDNIFVFPKRALILQSIINLKLLGREAEKLGKAIIVMTQDEQGMRLAEKAGLRTEVYHDAVLREHRQEADTRFTVKHGETIPMPHTSGVDRLRRSTEIGSASFYGTDALAVVNPIKSSETAPLPPTRVERHQPQPRPVRVRDMSPPMQPALNSKREIPKAARVLVSEVPGLMSENDTRKEKLRRLFQNPEQNDRTIAKQKISPPAQQPPSPVRREALATSKSRGWKWILVGILALGAILLGGYFSLRPEAIVSIEPQQATQSVKLSIVGAVDPASGSKTIPIRYIEEEKTVRLTREATGKDLGNAAKASGIIIITNTFSEASQPLVATTRFETSDGKIYRLVESVTIPGARTEGGNRVPGKIEARVIADVIGAASNITTATFTIPGFKGGPKYAAITAETKGTFVGGGEGSDAVLSVSASDLELARESAVDEARQAVITGLSSGLKPGEAALEQSFQTVLIGVPNAPTPGSTTPNSFEYEARFQVRGFVIFESALREVIAQETIESDGIILRPHTYEIGYGTVLANFETRRVDFTVESRVLFRSMFDEPALKEELLGLGEEGIRIFLGNHPEIKRLQVEFKPKIFIATIPEDASRVTLKLISGESE